MSLLFYLSAPCAASPTWTVLASVPINRMKRVLPHLLASGDDDGVIKVRPLARVVGRISPLRQSITQLWDPRKPDAVRKYTHHFDFISDFLWLEDKKQLVATRCAFERPPVTSLLSTRERHSNVVIVETVLCP